MGNVPKLRFKEFSGGWEEKELSYLISSLDAGVSVNSMDVIAKEGEKAILKTSCVSNGSFDISENKLVSDDSEIQRLKEPVRANTIIISRMNTPNLVGANAFINSDNDNIYLPDRLWSAKIKDTASAKWTSILIASPKIRTLLSSRATGTSNSMKNITKGDVLTLPVTITSKKEQEKIASFLTSVDTKIEQLTKKETLLQEYKKGVMQKIFNQEIRFRADDGREFPEWEEKELGEIFKRVVFKNKENNKNVLTISAQQGLINQEEFFNKSVSAKDVTNYYLISKNDFAYNKSYSNGYPMGAIKKLNRYEKGVVSTLYICFRILNGNYSADFYEKYFDSGLFNREIEKIAQEGARNHGLLNVSVVDFFSSTILPCPSIEEQIKIANFLSSIDNKIEQAQKQLEKTKEFKKALLQQMFM